MIKITSLSIMAAFITLGCWPSGQKGEFGGGWFKTHCEGQLPSLCELNPIPNIAVGMDPALYYDSESSYSDARVEPVSGRLLEEPGWSQVFSGTSVYIYDYTLMSSQAIRSMKIVRVGSSSETVLSEPIEVGCNASSFADYLVPTGSSGYLIGVGSWSGRIEPNVANVTFDGNQIDLRSNNTTASDVDALLTVTLEPEGLYSWDFDLTVCPIRMEPHEVIEVVDTAEPVEAADAAEAEEEEEAVETPDEDQEDAAEEGDLPAETDDAAEAEEDGND